MKLAIFFCFQAMSIYTTVSQQNLQGRDSQAHVDTSDPQIEDPLVNISQLTERGTTLAGQALPNEDDSLAEYFSDDEERQKALQQKKEKEQHLQNKLERET